MRLEVSSWRKADRMARTAGRRSGHSRHSGSASPMPGRKGVQQRSHFGKGKGRVRDQHVVHTIPVLEPGTTVPPHAAQIGARTRSIAPRKRPPRAFRNKGLTMDPICGSRIGRGGLRRAANSVELVGRRTRSSVQTFEQWRGPGHPASLPTPGGSVIPPHAQFPSPRKAGCKRPAELPTHVQSRCSRR